MNFFVQLPIAVRVAVLALVALIVARFINWAIYNWAYHRKICGPWAPPPAGGRRSIIDHMPILGWWSLRREAGEHGPGYWVRPMLIELLYPVLIVVYYTLYMQGLSLPRGVILDPHIVAMHWQFAGQFLLFSLLMIATFIDFDEQSIPDHITIPGTCLALTGALLAPAWYPFSVFGAFTELHAYSPRRWNTQLDTSTGLIAAVLIVLAWAFALLDRRWIMRRGFKKAVIYFFARILRSRAVWMSALAASGFLLLLIGYGWLEARPGRWTYLLSGLFGLAFAGGVTWGVRITASLGLGVEALGFGDVTLMAMIGAFVGWQPSLLVFFLAPLVAILFVIARWLITGETATPYGPYLCAATVIVLVCWNALWNNWAAPVFGTLGWVIVWIVIGCVALMGVLLWIWRLIKEAFLL